MSKISYNPRTITLLKSAEGGGCRKVFKGSERKASPPRLPSYYAEPQSFVVNDLSVLRDLIIRERESGEASHFVRGIWKGREHAEEVEAKRDKRATPKPLVKSFPSLGSEKPEPAFARNGKFFDDAPVSWICLDLDHIPLPEGEEADLSNPLPQVQKFLFENFGAEWRATNFLFVLSSSAGVKPGLRGHVYYMLAEALTSAQWRAWAERRNAPCDAAAFRTVQPLFFHRPIFEHGATDPMKGRKTIFLCSDGLEDELHLKWSEFEATLPEGAIGDAGKGGANADAALDEVDEEGRWLRAVNHPTQDIISAFNRTFSIPDAIEKFIPKVFEAVGTDRYAWVERGLDDPGCTIRDADTRMWVHYKKWGSHRNAHAFDLVCRFLHGGDFKKTAKWALKQPGVAASLSGLKAERGETLEDPYDNAVFLSSNDNAGNSRELVAELAFRGCLFRSHRKLVEVIGTEIVPVQNADRVHILAANEGLSFRILDEKGKAYAASQKEIGPTCRYAISQHDHPQLPDLVAVSDRPLFQGRDGLLLGEGYHPDIKRLVRLNPAWATLADAIPTNPTLDELRASVLYLRNRVLEGFAFDDEPSHAGAVSKLVTAVTRPAFQSAPAFVAIAEHPGSGKSALMRMAQQIAGCTRGALGFPGRGEEVEKAIVAKLLTGAPVVNIDNIGENWRLDDPTINRLITAEGGGFEGRRLGASEILTFQNVPLILVNGNRVRIEGDMATRCVVMRFDPGLNQPHERQHTRDDLGEWVAANLFEILKHALTVARWGAQHQHEKTLCHSRFPVWERIVAHPIEKVLGVSPVATMRAIKEESDGDKEMEDAMLLKELYAAFDGGEFIAKEAAKCAEYNLNLGAAFEIRKIPLKAGDVSRTLRGLAGRSEPYSLDERQAYKIVNQRNTKLNCQGFQVFQATPPAA